MTVHERTAAISLRLDPNQPRKTLSHGSNERLCLYGTVAEDKACPGHGRSCRKIASCVRPPVSPDRLAKRLGCVAIWFKILTYLKYAPLSNRIDALPLNAIYNFETASDDLLRFTRAHPLACLAERLKNSIPHFYL